MKRLFQRLFILVLMTVDLVSLAVACAMVIRGGHWAWLGAAIPSIMMLGFFSYLMIAGRARTSAALSAIHILGLAGMGVSFLASPFAALLAFVGVAFNLLYVYWYSKLKVPKDGRLVVGKLLPAFELEDVEGMPVGSDSFRGSPRLFLFFRGNWCPLCMAQIREVAEQYNELANRGVRVTLISPQPQKNTRELAEKFSVPFEFFVDRENRCATALGIVHEAGAPAGVAVGYDADTVLPTVLLTDRDGIVRWMHQTDNYRIRPEPELFLAAVDRELGARTTSGTSGEN